MSSVIILIVTFFILVVIGTRPRASSRGNHSDKEEPEGHPLTQIEKDFNKEQQISTIDPTTADNYHANKVERDEEMGTSLVNIGRVTDHWNTAYTKILKYSVEIYHEGLNEHKLISAPEKAILDVKVVLQVNKWNERWDMIEAKTESLQEAEIRSREAEEDLRRVENLLLHSLSIDNTINWQAVMQRGAFNEPKPSRPEKKAYNGVTSKPDKKASQFTPTFSFFDKLIPSRRERKIKEYNEKYDNAVFAWEKRKAFSEKLNINYEKALKEWDNAIKNSEERKDLFYQEQKRYNEQIENLRKSYFKKDIVGITDYCETVLINSDYPDTFPENFEIEYNPNNKILIVEYELPSQEHLPKLKGVKYIASKKKLEESFISDSQLTRMYDNVIYQITLRTMHELFEADALNVLAAISFNGWVNSINEATGIKRIKCILSIQAKKDEFMEIQLANVDSKACFKNLKGVASSKLSSLTPIQPILQISKADKRFIEGYDVADYLDETTNVAAMDWEDFEHLIREIFEKEFSVNGGEVKVTQASRDGGVDAIAFDPDPIRGGKIVIQAKRYTNTVGVSAVRDLYGTVLNEGATKGILVTTADYGPEAYKFARGKPLTLLNGSNLLHLLEKHGHHAKIDLMEAKQILSENQ